MGLRSLLEPCQWKTRPYVFTLVSFRFEWLQNWSGLYRWRGLKELGTPKEMISADSREMGQMRPNVDQCQLGPYRRMIPSYIQINVLWVIGITLKNWHVLTGFGQHLQVNWRPVFWNHWYSRSRPNAAKCFHSYEGKAQWLEGRESPSFVWHQKMESQIWCVSKTNIARE